MKKILVLLLVLSVVSISGCKNETAENQNYKNAENEMLSEIEITSDIDIGSMDLEFTDNDTKTSFSENEIINIADNEKIINITDDKIYKISGKHNQIVVSSTETAKPRIILENAEINCANGPAIYIESADKVFITVAENTVSTLSCGETFDTKYGNADGTVFSKSDLTINGSGKLSVNGNYKCGIVSKDDLNIVNAQITVDSKGAAIEGKDCVKITDSTINCNAGTDAIKSTNTEDSDRGYVLIESGNFNLTSNNDGIQVATALFIKNGNFNITTGGGSTVSSNNYGKDGNRWGMWSGYENYSSTDTESSKALKATSLIEISNGEFIINSSDDSIHSNSDIEIKGGNFEINSGDDGIHSDDQLIISAGTIKISKSYEGIEATAITVSGGNIDVTSTDDGFNAAGGNDSSAMGGRPGQNPFESDSDAQINFTGGYVLVNASGDGIDSNGDITLTGGVLLVSGPTNSGNGALDYGGTAVVNGGVAVITGTSGMATTFSSASAQASFMYNIESDATAKSAVSVTDGNKVIASFTPNKEYNSIIVSCPSFKVGSTYKLNIGGSISNADQNGYTENGVLNGAQNSYEIELTSVSVSNGGNSFGGGMQRPGGGMQRPGGGKRW